MKIKIDELNELILKIRQEERIILIRDLSCCANCKLYKNGCDLELVPNDICKEWEYI